MRAGGVLSEEPPPPGSAPAASPAQLHTHHHYYPTSPDTTAVEASAALGQTGPVRWELTNDDKVTVLAGAEPSTKDAYIVVFKRVDGAVSAAAAP